MDLWCIVEWLASSKMPGVELRPCFERLRRELAVKRDADQRHHAGVVSARE
jgi:hypothetical protein